MKIQKPISKPLYEKMQRIMPMLCVDLIIKTANGLVLGRRNNEPVKGRIWFIGGGVLRGETLDAAAKRKAKEETGLDVRILRKVGIYETFFQSKHTVNILYLVESKGGKLRADSQHSEFVYLNGIGRNRELDAYIIQGIKDSRVFSRKRVQNLWHHRVYNY